MLVWASQIPSQTGMGFDLLQIGEWIGDDLCDWRFNEIRCLIFH